MRTIGEMLRRLGFSSYAAYRSSRHWRKFRNNLQAGKPNCMCCDDRKGSELHHLSYESLGREKHRDVIALCRKCHENIHDALDNKFPNTPVEFQVSYTKEVIQQATGTSWQHAEARWSWYLKELNRLGKQFKSAKKARRKGPAKKRAKGATKQSKLQRLMSTLAKKNKTKYTTYVCQSCKYKVTREVGRGQELPCVCGRPGTNMRVEATAQNSPLHNQPASVSKTIVLADKTAGLDSANDQALSPPFACN